MGIEEVENTCAFFSSMNISEWLHASVTRLYVDKGVQLILNQFFLSLFYIHTLKTEIWPIFHSLSCRFLFYFLTYFIRNWQFNSKRCVRVWYRTWFKKFGSIFRFIIIDWILFKLSDSLNDCSPLLYVTTS